MIWYYVPLWCCVVEEDGEFIATIPDVDDVEGRGDNPIEASRQLAESVFFTLRMG